MYSYHTKLFDIRIDKPQEIEDWINSFQERKVAGPGFYAAELVSTHVLQGNCIYVIVKVSSYERA